jgi:tetratricopeptide (TPR) repeat protein
MKNLLLALTLLFSVQLAAQTKEVADAIKNYEKAKKESADPKKGANPATWIKLADAYAEIFDSPVKSIWNGASRNEIKLLLKDQRIASTEDRTVQGVKYSVDVYDDKELYYNEDGTLACFVQTKEYVPGNIIDEGVAALVKAAELDTKNAKSKDITEKLVAMKTRYQSDAMAAYTLGNFKKASTYFEGSVKISSHPLIKQVDTVMMYYTGLTALMAKDYDTAAKYLQMSIDNNYDAKGDIYSSLAEAYKAKGDMAKTKEVLQAGFTKHPTNQSILVTLINSYLESNDDPNKVLALITQAQKNEPMNASLYYAEGNVWKNMKNVDKAIECYKKSMEIDKTYYFGSFAIGAAYYDRAVDIQTAAAEEVDDTKYEALVKQLEENLIAAIEPFESCFSNTSDNEVKLVVAEYLKNIYFRFRDKDASYKAGLDKYTAYLNENKK